jgi:hypothetical protein
MKRIATSLVALVAIVAAGAVNGWMTDRWGAPEALAQAAARVTAVPNTIGEWEGVDQTIDQDQLIGAEAIGSLARTYRHRGTGKAVNIMLLCGRPGPISLHPPTVCFTSSGFALIAEPSQRRINSPANEPLGDFMQADFVKETVSERTLMRTFWAWSTDGKWSAPENPRFTFATSSHLHKLYVTRALTTSTEALDENDACVEFMRDFLPATQAALGSASSDASPASEVTARRAPLRESPRKFAAAFGPPLTALP